ncbi:MAG: GldG family protein [Bryobacteraceae bacterium]
MNTDWLRTRQTKYTGYATLYIAIILAVLVLANWLANRHNKSFDATSNKRFSLSDQTEKVVRGLDREVTVTYFDETTRFPTAKDLLDRYDNLSTRLKVVYVDPYKKPQLARAAGVKTTGTIFVEAGIKREEARSLTEEEITGALIRAIKDGERTVCFVSGSGEHDVEDSDGRGYSQVRELLEKNNYKVDVISLLEKPEVPTECTILVVAGPRYEYTQPAVDAIRGYVQNGGRAAFLLDPPLQLGRDSVSENQPLAKLLDSWGVVLNKDIVLDTSGVGQLFGLGPEVPLVTSYDSHAIVREMKGTATAFALARSLETKSADKVTVETLFSTTSNSFATTNLAGSAIRLDPARDKKGPFPIGAAGSYETGKANEPGRFVVVGSSDWIANYTLRFQGNRDLFLNMMNWLSSDEDLISIRPKEPEDRKLTLTRAQMNVIRTTSQFALPLLVILAGVVVWWRRR